MITRNIPKTILAAAETLLAQTMALVEHVSGEGGSSVRTYRADPWAKAAEASFLHSYFALVEQGTDATCKTFHQNAFGLEKVVTKCIGQTLLDDQPNGGAALMRAWQGKWLVFDRLWQTWCETAPRSPASKPPHPLTAMDEREAVRRDPSLLSDDQRSAVDRLLTYLRIRAEASEAALPTRLVPRWGVPLIVGPAGSGKMVVCEEVGRRWGNRPCRRWEIGNWIAGTRSAAGKTEEKIGQFMEANRRGCVIYLAGLDALMRSDGPAGMDCSTFVTQLEAFLDRTTHRRATSVLVVFGSRFAPLWGDGEAVAHLAGEAWKNPDPVLPPDAGAVAAWMEERSLLPVSILRRLAAEPLLLRPMEGDEAERLATRIHKTLPPSLDGISVEEVYAALKKPQGWHALARIIEHAFVEGHEPMSLPTLDRVEVSPEPLARESVRFKHPKKGEPILLRHKLRMAPHPSVVLERAKQLGLDTVVSLETLAQKRGYTLPHESLDAVLLSEEVPLENFSDLELMLALLSPSLEFSERAICRGAVMLHAVLAVIAPYIIVGKAREERTELVVRHIAGIGFRLDQNDAGWLSLLTQLPNVTRSAPEPPPDTYPDEALRQLLADLSH